MGEAGWFWNVLLLVAVVGLVVVHIWTAVVDHRERRKHRQEIERFWHDALQRYDRQRREGGPL